MLGGLWGAKTYLSRWSIANAAVHLINEKLSPKRLIKGVDQELLSFHIWPLAKKNMV